MELPVAERTGLELILSQLTLRYVSDARGRLVASTQGDGVLPRFVLGRAAEGCVWRFRADLADALLRNVAKLAGREPGWGLGQTPVRPERLEMISRLLGADRGAEVWSRETFEFEGQLRAELWSFSTGGIE